MMVRALKKFPLYRDGITAEEIEEGRNFDCPDEMVAGLESAGLVTKSRAKAEDAAPENKAKLGAPMNRTYTPEGDVERVIHEKPLVQGKIPHAMEEGIDTVHYGDGKPVHVGVANEPPKPARKK